MLREAFRKQYKAYPLAKRVIVVAGVNDVRNTSVEDFKMEMEKWVQELGDDNCCGMLDKIKFSHMIRPPMLAWLNGNGVKPNDLVDFSEKIRLMNQAIDEVNEMTNDDIFNPVSFVNMGRRITKNGKEQHKWSDWREKSKNKMLHLNDKGRHNMLARLENAFAYDFVSTDHIEMVPEGDHRGAIMPDGSIIVDTPFKIPE